MEKADLRLIPDRPACATGFAFSLMALIVASGLWTALASATASAQQPSGDPSTGTELTMRPVTVKDQHQLRGRFGDKWDADEVKARAAATCAAAGMRLVYFKPEAPDAKKQTEFAAVCQ